MKCVLLSLLCGVAFAGCTAPPAPPSSNGVSFTENFDGAEAMPQGWTSKVGTWRLFDERTAPSAPHVLQQEALVNDSLPHIIADGKGTFGNVEISVDARPVGGSRALSAGIVFRYVDGGNYYVARLSGAEQNVRVFEYARGLRDSYENTFQHPFPLGNWTQLKVRAVGDAFSVFIDGQTAITVHDPTLQVGNVGLWVSDDSFTQFDNVRVTRL